MNFALLYQICLAYGLYNLANICFTMTLSNIHDVQVLKNRPATKYTHPTVDYYVKLPLVSIIIPAHNEERVIKRCLLSILDLDYPHFEVIIVNDGSKDKTHQESLNYMWQFHTKDKFNKKSAPNIKYINLKSNIGKAKALNEGLKVAKGEIVTCMDADAIFKKDALLRGVNYFKDPNVAIVAVNNKLIAEKFKPLYILQRFDFIGNYRSKKAYDVINAEYIVSGIGAMYRKKELDEIGGIPVDTMTEDIDTSLAIVLLGSKNHRVKYAEDVITYMEPVHTFKDLVKQRFRWKFGNMQSLFKQRHKLKISNTHSSWLIYWRIPLAIISELTTVVEIAFFGFMFYLSVVLGNGLFLLASYLVATFLLTLTIFADDTVTKNERKDLLPFIPIMYFLSLVMNIIQLWAFVKSIVKINELHKRTDGYSWKSPVRTGETLFHVK
jgi:poly-beta-1,6-N-acetyl-D-glucosamine synthase